MRTIALFFFISFLIQGCEGRQVGEPPDIHYGRDRCGECGMIIDEERFAAVMESTDGHVHKFDGMGCALEFRRKNQREVKALWTHDYETLEWVNVAAAYFINSKEIVSPMGDGIVAFSCYETAKNIADKEQIKIIRFEELSGMKN